MNIEVKGTIGYTSGVFDLFHIGHLNLLRKAKEHCDYLIVGVTTDREVMRVKKKTPIIPFHERLEIIEAIKYVDKAVPEDDTDKLLALDNFNFNVIFKGDDWKGTALWTMYENEFSKRDVHVKYFTYTEGTSSTMLTKYLSETVK